MVIRVIKWRIFQYYPARDKTVDLGNGLPAFTSKTHTVQPGASSFDEPVEENFGRIYFKLDYDFSQSKVPFKFSLL